MIYLAGPIDQANHEQQEWRAKAKDLLHDSCFDPHAAFTQPLGGDQDVNDAAIRKSRAVLIVINDLSQGTIGTWMELRLAKDLGIPVVISTSPRHEYPVALKGTTIFNSLRSACDYLNAGKFAKVPNLSDLEEDQSQVIAGILQERERQNRKYPVQPDSNTFWSFVLGEEIGEVQKELKIIERSTRQGLYDEVQDATDRMAVELEQVAAVAVAWLEWLQKDIT